MIGYSSITRCAVLSFAFVPYKSESPLAMFDEWVLKFYRISVQPWLSWLADWAINQFIVILAASVLGYIVYTAIRNSPRHWWLHSRLLSLPLVFFFVFVSPVVIDPIFNRYEPLSSKAPQLISELQQISRRAGEDMPRERMFWMLASDKTIATNAIRGWHRQFEAHSHLGHQPRAGRHR